jgi:hypothetical protein
MRVSYTSIGGGMGLEADSEDSTVCKRVVAVEYSRHLVRA